MSLTRKSLYVSFLAFIMLESCIAQADSTSNTSQSYYNQERQPTPIFITPDQLHWHSIETFPGAYCAILEGNPSREGFYLLRLKLPAHYKVAPSWQTTTIFVTVISGSYHIGVGDKFDLKQGKTLGTGSSIIIPSKSHLYFWTSEEVILQIHGLGPWNIHYVDPEKDPRKQ